MRSVASEAIEFVDHDHVDVALLEDPRQHGLELRPFARALGGGVAIGVLVGKRPALVSNVLQACLALRRQ